MVKSSVIVFAANSWSELTAGVVFVALRGTCNTITSFPVTLVGVVVSRMVKCFASVAML